MPIISKDELRGKAQVKTELLDLPELGEGAQMRIRGYRACDRTGITQSCLSYDADGSPVIDQRQNMALSLLAVIVEPELTLEDTQWLLELDDSVITKILNFADTLSGRTLTAYDGLKRMLRDNYVLRRFYSVCVNKLGRLPSELSGVSEEEFMTALAAIELDDEDIEEEMASRQR